MNNINKNMKNNKDKAIKYETKQIYNTIEIVTKPRTYVPNLCYSMNLRN